MRRLRQVGFVVKTSVTANVTCLDSGVSEDGPDEQPPVALRRVLLTAHHGNAISTDAIHQPLDTLAKDPSLRDTRVQRVTVVVIQFRRELRASSELTTEIDVLQACLKDSRSQFSSVEMRYVSGIWSRPDIGKHVNVVHPQQCQELFDRLIRVPDGIHDHSL